jgi:hypothetical protein
MLFVCLCIPSYQLVYAWTNLYGTWYVYNGTWAHPNDVFKKNIVSLCVCMCIPLSLLGNGSAKIYRGNEYIRNSRRTVRRLVYYAVRFVTKESRRLILP